MTENYLRLGLLLIAAVIVTLILFEAWNKRRHLKLMKSLDISNGSMNSLFDKEDSFTDKNQVKLSEVQNKKSIQQQATNAHDMLMVSVLAKPNRQFASYELMQAIVGAGFQFGAMNLFHYSQTTSEGTDKLFSLAAATKSGEFDIDNMGDFSCKGLILFFDPSAVDNPEEVFDLMLMTADRLADDLDGELRADLHTPWSNDTYVQYQNKIVDLRQAAIA